VRIIILQGNINWIDNLKAFGILAVILGHIASPFSSFIFSWHMPLFFMISGFFIKFDLSPKDFILKDFKRLMIPYFIFSMIALVLEELKRIVLHRELLDFVNELKGVFLWMDITSLINTYAFVLWFLPALFFAKVILLSINKYIQNIFLQFITISMLFTSSFYINLPFALDNGMNAVLFIFIGNIFFRFYQDNKLLYLLPIIFVGLYFVYGVPSLDVASKNYGLVMFNIVWALSFIGIFVLVLKKINIQSTILTLWGGNTMLLFIIHPYTNNIAHIVVEKLHFGDWFFKLFLSLLLLQIILFIKLKYNNRGLFKYV